MKQSYKIKKGLDLHLEGKAAPTLDSLLFRTEVALVPDDFHGVVPRVLVKEGESVLCGTPLFADKATGRIKFVSPVSGEVTMVQRGERRKVLSIVVTPNGTNDAVDFGVKSVHSLTPEQVKATMLESGVMAFVRQRPYDIVANPQEQPKAIFVSAFDSAPLAPDFEYVLQGREADWQAGLSALAKLAPTYLGISKKQTAQAIVEANNVQKTTFKGPPPAGNVGVQMNHVRPINKGEVMWTVAAQDVLLIGSVFNQGKVNFERTLALAGSMMEKPAYVKTLVGAKIDSIVGYNVKWDRPYRLIDGNVLTGRKSDEKNYLCAFSNMLTAIPEGNDVNELFGWIMPRFNHFSVSRSFISFLTPKREYDIDCRIKGGERHMIASGEYDKVFPMNIYPEYLIKAIITGDIEKMEAMGIYEVAPEDFALCEFVDSSKLELQRIVREGLDNLRKEME